MEQIVQIFKKCKQQKSYQKFEITYIKEKRLFLMSKSFKIILIIPTLNILTISTSNLLEKI
jgi:hypothetical protein